MNHNLHFETVSNWQEARGLVMFPPLIPGYTSGCHLQSISIHVRDYRLRDFSLGKRTLEAHYGGFVLSQTMRGAGEARRLALDVSYGQAGRTLKIAGHVSRVYELGPEPEPDDIDGRIPAVVTWHDAGMFYLIASDQLSSEELVRIANSLYE